MFPEKLVETILEHFTEPNDIIYDPFLGMGTTAVVAKKMERQYIRKWNQFGVLRVSEERLENALTPLELLIKSEGW